MTVEREHRADVPVPATTLAEVWAIARQVDDAVLDFAGSQQVRRRVVVQHRTGRISAQSVEEAEAEASAIATDVDEVTLSLIVSGLTVFVDARLGPQAAVLPPYCSVTGTDEFAVLGVSRKLEKKFAQAADVSPTVPSADPEENPARVFGPVPDPNKKSPGARHRMVEGIVAGVLATGLIAGATYLYRIVTPDPPRVIAFHEAGASGTFQFTPKKWRCTARAELAREAARGKHCVLDVEIMNVGDTDESLTLVEYTVRIQDDKYPALDAGLALTSERVFPRKSIVGQVVFDVPKDEEPETLLVQSSFTSRGVVFKLP